MNKKKLAADEKILRRCTICKKFHASYLVEDLELGKYYLCYTCWKARQAETETQVKAGTKNISEQFLSLSPKENDL